MSFVRVFIGRTSNAVRHVAEQDVPFAGAGHVVSDSKEPLDAIDLGFVEHRDWIDLEGNPTCAAHHIFLRLEKNHAGMPSIHDCPCTIGGIKQRLREQGPAGIPTKARAWLAAVLPEDQVRALGIGDGIPLSVLAAAEALRQRRDPNGGDRLMVLQRRIQQRSDARSAKALSQRLKKQKDVADSATRETTQPIEANSG